MSDISISEATMQSRAQWQNKIFLPLLLAYIIPCLTLGPIALFIGPVTKEEYIMTITDPVLILFLGIMVIFPISGYVAFLKDVRAYNGSEESVKYMNRKVKLSEVVTIFIILAMYIVEPFLVDLRMNQRGFTYVAFGEQSSFYCWFSMLLGLTCLYSLLMFIIFMRNLEHSLSWLPYKKEYQTMSLSTRAISVTVFVVCGVVLMSESVITVPTNLQLSVADLLLKRLFPIVVLAIILAGIDSYLNMTDIRDGIAAIERFSDTLSQRDYTVQPVAVICRCDIGALANHMNRFGSGSRALVGKVKSSLQQSLDNAHSLSDQMNNASGSVGSITSNIASVSDEMDNQSAGVEEANASVNQIMARIRDLNKSVESQASAVNESSAAVDEMVANIRSVTQILEKNTEAVNSLSQASDDGRNSVRSAVETSDEIIKQSLGLLDASKIIQNIASQTNLLAMNAAIESAHAGAAGKGFAVVADEIRKLAEQSNKQGKVINDSLKSLSAAIGKVSASTKEVQQKFDAIYNSAQTVKNQEDVIHNAMVEQSSGNQQVLDAMKDISDSTNTVRDGAAEMLSGGEQVVKEMSILGDVTRKINDNMGQMSKSVHEISDAMNNVAASSSKNQHDIETLNGTLAGFKV